MKRSLSHFGVLTLLALGIALTLGQGDLGPSQLNGSLDAENNPQRSMKTLEEIEPRNPVGSLRTPGDQETIYRITRSGSYYLTGDLVGVEGKHGIVIAASNVDLDLNGFTLLGGEGTRSGIVAGANTIANTSIRNGTVCQWGENGIDLENAAIFTEVRAVRSMQNLMHGFKVNHNVKAVTVTTVANGLDGFHCLDDSKGGVWIGVLASDNGGIGIKAGAASTLKDCAAKGNTGIGIMAGEASTLGNCTAAFNEEGGIAIGPRGTIDLCSASSNGLIDIKTDEGCVVVESTAGGGQVGIALGDASRARGCVVSGSGVGLRLGSNSRAMTVTITASRPNAAAIQILGTGNRIESSHVSVSDPASVGIAAQDPANLFIGLSATGAGTQFSLPQGAAQGPIVSGDEVPQNLSPHANFSF